MGAHRAPCPHTCGTVPTAPALCSLPAPAQHGAEDGFLLPRPSWRRWHAQAGYSPGRRHPAGKAGLAGAGSGMVTWYPAASQAFYWCPVMPDPWHNLLLPSWGPVPQPPAWAMAAKEAAVSPWQWLLCTASHEVAGTRCPRYQSVLHHPQSLSPGWEQASQTQPGSGTQGSSLVIFHSGFLPRSGQALPASSPALFPVSLHSPMVEADLPQHRV